MLESFPRTRASPSPSELRSASCGAPAQYGGEAEAVLAASRGSFTPRISATETTRSVSATTSCGRERGRASARAAAPVFGLTPKVGQALVDSMNFRARGTAIEAPSVFAPPITEFVLRRRQLRPA